MVVTRVLGRMKQGVVTSGGQPDLDRYGARVASFFRYVVLIACLIGLFSKN